MHEVWGLWAFGTDPRDARFSPVCIGVSFLTCVLPGLAGAGYAAYRAFGVRA